MKKVKELTDLTEKEFNKLKKSGLLNVIYADAPNTYKELKGVRPKVKTNPDFKPLIQICEEYLNHIQNPELHAMKDGEHYIFEEAIKCVYGKNEESGIWDFINANE